MTNGRAMPTTRDLPYMSKNFTAIFATTDSLNEVEDILMDYAEGSQDRFTQMVETWEAIGSDDEMRIHLDFISDEQRVDIKKYVNLEDDTDLQDYAYLIIYS